MPWEPLPGDRADEPAPIGTSLDRVLRGLGAPKAEAVGSVFERWPELVGEQIASHCRPVSLRSGTLTVAVRDPAWATEFRFLESRLLERLAAVLGPGEVTALEVRVRPDRGGAAR